MANQEPKTLTINKGEPFKVRWKFTTDEGEKIDTTCRVVFTGVTMPSENGISYEIQNLNNEKCTDLTAEELSSMYVTTSTADTFEIQLSA